MSVIPTSSVVVVAVEGIVVGVDLDAEDIFEARAFLYNLGNFVGSVARVDHLDEHADGSRGEVGQGKAVLSVG